MKVKYALVRAFVCNVKISIILAVQLLYMRANTSSLEALHHESDIAEGEGELEHKSTLILRKNTATVPLPTGRPSRERITSIQQPQRVRRQQETDSIRHNGEETAISRRDGHHGSVSLTLHTIPCAGVVLLAL